MWEGQAPLVALVQVVAGGAPAPVAVQAVAVVVALLVAEEALLNPDVVEMFSRNAVSSLPVFLLPSKKVPASDILCPHPITYRTVEHARQRGNADCPKYL